jgi:uncharacterized protein (TIGR02453 family)
MREFQGFPEDTLHFLHELSLNNDKGWFEANKERYQANVLAHAPAFVEALGSRLQDGISPGIVYDTRANGAGSMMRIYRDTRFSRDKTPYKTNVAFIFWEGPAKKMENPSFGFQFGTFGAGLYGGVFGFTTELLAKYRQAVVDPKTGPALEQAMAAVRAAGEYRIEGEQYKRVPAGFDAEHPRAELLLYKGLYASAPQFDIQLVTTPEIVDICYEHCRNMAPIQQWLVAVDRA